MKSIPNIADHGWGEDLELYALGRLAPDRIERLEEHLLECEPCRVALDEAVVYCQAMRRELSKPEERKAGWLTWLRTPGFALVAAAVLMAVVAGWYVMGPSTPRVPLATIQLVAIRGEMPVAEAARETELRLMDAGDFSGTAEVVDGNGKVVWKGPVSAGKIPRITKALQSGPYFVRLYDGTTLRNEYGFLVK